MKPTKGPKMTMAVVDDPGEDSEAPVEILIYDVIDSIGGEWGVSATEVVTALANLRGRDLKIRINSEGGMATEGAAIYAALTSHDARVDIQIDGVAASAAAFIAMAGDTVRMHETATMMIHGAWTFALGNSEDLRRAADELDVFNAGMVAAFAARTKKEADYWQAELGNDRWFTSQQAQDEGLVDEVIPAGRQQSPVVSMAAVMSARQSMPIPVALGGLMATRTQKAASAATTEPAQLAITEDPATELAETTVEPDPTVKDPDVEEDNNDDDATSDQLAADADVVTLDRETYEDLVRQATSGTDGVAAAARRRREGLVDSAVQAGKIPPARRSHWLTALEADPGMEATLAGLAPGLVPLAEVGSSTDALPSQIAATTPDSLVRQLFPRP